MRRLIHYPLFFLAAASLLSSCGLQQAVVSSSESSGTAITNVTVIDANGVRERSTVIFAGDEIVTIQPASAPVDSATIINGTGRYLIPGLWDFHVHLTYDERLVAAMPELFLYWGITSVRDTGGLIEDVLPVVEAMRQDDAIAPRVFYAGPLLDGENVVYDGHGRPEIGTAVPDPAAARRIVRELHAQGVDFIKVYEMVTPEVFDALVAEANALGLPIDSHVPLSLRARHAGAQVDSIEHLRNIEMDCAAGAEALHAERLRRLENPEGLSGAELRSSLHALQRLPAVYDYDEAQCDQVIAALSDTVMVPTLRLNSFGLMRAWRRPGWQQALDQLPEDIRADWAADVASRRQQPVGNTDFAQWSVFLTGRMHEAGVPIGAGTDTPINLSIPGFALHSELAMLVSAGLTPLEALAAATLVPARFFSREAEMGTIEVGKVADLVLLGSDPLEDINNTRDIVAVISKGRRTR